MPSLIFLLLSVVLASFTSLNLLVLFSDLTPSIMTHQIESSLSGSIYSTLSRIPSINCKYLTAKITSSETSKIPQIDADILIDVTYSPETSQILASLAISQDFLHIISNRPINRILGEFPSTNTLYTDMCFRAEATAINEFITSFKWEKVNIIYDSHYDNIQTARYLKEISQGNVEFELELLLEDSWKTNSEIVEIKVKNILKQSTSNIFILFVDPQLAALILEFADYNGIGGSGYAWLLSENTMIGIEDLLKFSSIYIPYEKIGVIKSGAIGFLADDIKASTEDPLFRLSSTLDLVFRVIDGIASTKGSEISNYVKQNNKLTKTQGILFSSLGMMLGNINVFNIVNYAKYNIGVWEYSKMSLEFNSRQIIWPGGELKTFNKMHSLKLGIIKPASEDIESFYILSALSLAFSEINSNFFLGSEYRLDAIYQNSLPPISSLILDSVKQYEASHVIGYIGPSDSDLTTAYALALSSDKYPKPIVSYSASVGYLSDSNTYSSFIRLIQQDGFEATAVSFLISRLKYKKIGLIASDDTIGTTMYNAFIENIKALKLTVVNSIDNRKVRTKFNADGKLSSKTKDDIDKVLSNIVRNQIKVIVYLGNKKLSPHVAKIAYRKELYGNDYAWFGSNWIDDSVLADIDENYSSDKENILRVFRGAFSLSQISAQGDFGESFASSFLSKTGKNYTTLAMLAYDSVYLYANTIKSMISDNQDFTDGELLLNTLRRTTFVGASGNVELATETNDRTSYGYTIMNMQDSSLIPVYLYAPQSTSTFINNSYVPIQFYDGTNEPPSDTWSQTFDCPFAEPMSKISTKGVSIVIAIGIFFFGITLGISFKSYSKWKQVKIIQISEPVIRSWKDNFVQVQILIEFFQFIAIAPILQSLKIVLNIVSNVFMLDVVKITSSDKQNFWILLTVVSVLSYFWIFVVIMISSNIEQYLMKYQFIRKIIGVINSAYLPFIGNTMFLPFTSILFDTFVCDHEAQGQQYNSRDCYMTCWSPSHIPYILLSSFALISYVPASVFLRPLWQQAKPGLNLKIQPFFLLLKTCFQILLVSINKSLLGISPLANGIIFITIFVAFGILTFKIQPFNYNRCNLWEISSIMGVIYYSIISTVSQRFDPNNILWFVGLCIGWGAILFVTVLWQKKSMPDYLMASVMKRPRKSLKDVFSNHKITSLADGDIRKSVNNSEFFKSRGEFDISQDANDNSMSRLDVVDLHNEKKNNENCEEEMSFR